MVGYSLIHYRHTILQFNPESLEGVIRFGDWSEHISSLGIPYYYNWKTDVSQWEKPAEYIEGERFVYRAMVFSMYGRRRRAENRPSRMNYRR